MLAIRIVPVPAADALPAAVLIWDGGQVSPACERRAELERNVAAYLGREAFEPNAPLTIRVSVKRDQDGRAIAADVSKIGEDGKVIGVRSVSGGATCDTLDDPLTLVVALMLDAPPEEPQPAAPPTPEPLAPPETTPPEPISSDAAATPEDTASAPGFAVLTAGISSSIGLLPFPNYGPRLQVDLKPRHFWGLSLSGLALFGAHTELPGSGAIDFRMLQIGAALCPLDAIRDRNWFAACGGVEIAWLEADGSGLYPHRRKTDWALSPSLRVQAARELSSLVLLGGSLGVSFPTARNRYTYRDSTGSSHLAFEVASPALVLGLFAAFRLY